MKCSNCGTEIKEGMLFCPKCGTRQDSQAAQEKKSGISGRMIAVTALSLAAAVAAITAAVFLFRGREELPGQEDMDISETDQADIIDEEPLYSIEDVTAINYLAREYTPGTKEPGMSWNSELFYWLEDADTLSPDDGNIAGCKVSKTLLRDARTGQLSQYEIYSDPDNGSIYKVVSIISGSDGLELTDYYYVDGQPNFVFRRQDTVYTPTYATIGKVGERYYFDNDVLVRWRMIAVPGEIGEYTLAPEDVWYSQADYYAESDEIREIYDATELRMLNEAHIVYDTITKSQSTGVVQGCLRNTVGDPVAGKTVRLYRIEDGTLLYEAETDANGQFACYVYLDGTSCSLKVEADEQYRELTMQGVELVPTTVIYDYDLTAHKESGDEYPVSICLYPAADMVSDEEGNMTAEALRQAEAVVREGGGNYSGEEICRAETQDGALQMTLPSGIYTVQLKSDSFTDTWLELEVMEEAVSTDAYMMAGLAENQTAAVLTWAGDGIDLDLTLFTPYQAADGDMAHIGGNVREDGHGNILVSDNASRCEVMYLNTGEMGSYKLYVNNYTDSLSGNYDSGNLSAADVHVYLYNSHGFVADYSLTSGQSGVVWEVAEVSGSAITPAQRVYTQIRGKKWWLENKEVWNEEEDAALLAVLNDDRSQLRDLMEALVHNLSSESINTLLQGEKEGIEIFFGLDGREMPTAVYLNYTFEHDSDDWEELSKQVYAEYFLTEKDAEDLLYSICGKRIDFDFTVYDKWIEPYIGFGGAAGDISWDTLEHFSIERVGADTWKVRANDVYHIDDGEPSRVSSRVCFTVTRNPDSYFEGYSLTAFTLEEEADTGWAQAYYDFLTTDPDGVLQGYELAEDDREYFYNLIYLDADMIPEIYVQFYNEMGHLNDMLLFWANGSVSYEWISSGTYNAEGAVYAPYTGLLRDDDGRWGVVWSANYKLENGQWIFLGQHLGKESWENGQDVLTDETYTLGNEDNKVTREQYEETINGYFGTVELQPCMPERGYDYSLLELLENFAHHGLRW
ncbi:MAG: zinc-ribbon domain-containing protein [Blautia sp.]|nr:zinc-ribbon domain-containing protein [Blautia sp.]